MRDMRYSCVTVRDMRYSCVTVCDLRYSCVTVRDPCVPSPRDHLALGAEYRTASGTHISRSYLSSRYNVYLMGRYYWAVGSGPWRGIRAPTGWGYRHAEDVAGAGARAGAGVSDGFGALAKPVPAPKRNP